MVKGLYIAREDGLHFQHDPDAVQEHPCTPEEFLVRFRNDFQMNVLEQPDDNTLVFEMIHCDASFVNALRRILLSEVPTVALEHIYMWNNTSIVHDEVLAHRLGLIPLDLDARLLEDVEEDEDEEFTPTDRNTVVFKLKVSCPKMPKPEHDTHYKDDDDVVSRDPELEEAARDAAAAQKLKYPKDRPYTKHVYSSDFEWVPQGDQQDTLKSVNPIHDDILIAKLRPGQAIELEAHGRRGIGKDHAKYSPVATASYRLLPQIEIVEPIYDDLAEELVHVLEPGVFKLVKANEHGHKVKAVVCNPYACTMSRNYMRNPTLKKSIRMGRVADHFIFSVESVGAYSPGVLVAEALRVLQQKCLRVMDLVDASTNQAEKMVTK